MASLGVKGGLAGASAVSAQLQFDSRVEAHAQKMMINYRMLLKKFASLSSQEGIGRHEKMQVETCSEVIVHHAEQLLDMIQELRVCTLRLDSQSAEDNAGPTEMSTA